MHIWTIEKWRKFYENVDVRTGVRLKFDKDVNPEVRRACKEFCKWMRTEYYFPIRIPIYVKSSYQIKAEDGEMVYGLFLNFKNRCHEPYITIASGDYEELYVECGKDNALAAILSSMAHEITHYFQWVNDIHLTEIGEERQAKAYAGFILDEYKETREHP